MKLAWLTPLSDRSDIGAHSRCIVEALPDAVRDGSCVFINDNPLARNYEVSLPSIILTDDLDTNLLDLFDFCVFNIGNNQENHLYINKLSLQKGGIVVVHDIVMQHFVAWLLFESQKSPERYAEIMVHYYGDKALDVLESSRLLQRGRTPRYAPWDSVHSISYPLLEPFLVNAQAIVVHSEFAERVVRKMSDRPVIKLFLPCDKKPSPKIDKASPRQHIDFVSIGHIGRSKFLHLVVSAFSKSDVLRSLAKFTIVGMPNDKQYIFEIEQQVAALDLSANVRFELAVSENKLSEIKSAADVFVNVRFPNTESASGSLTEQMACGRPVIVMNSGCYVEVPDDCVVKINSLDDASDLTTVMEQLVSDAKLRDKIGANAFKYISRRTAASYGEQLVAGLKKLMPVPEGAASNEKRKKIPRSRLRSRPHWILDPRTDTATPEVWVELGPLQCARLLFLVRRDGTPSQDDIDAVAALLRTVEQPLRGHLICRYMMMNALIDKGEIIGIDELDLDVDGFVFAIMLSVSKDDFAKALYRVILGRMEFQDETLAYVLRLNDSANVKHTVDEFLSSEEYRWRRLTSEFTEAVVCTIGAAGDLLTVRADNTPTLASRIKFGASYPDSGRFLVGAWYEPEVDGVWSQGTEAGLQFRATTDAAQNDYLVIALRVAGSEHLGSRKCCVYVNELVRLRVSIDNDDRTLIRIPLEEIDAEEVVSVRISVEKAAKLSEFGGSDTRHLGVYVFEAFFEKSLDPGMTGV